MGAKDLLLPCPGCGKDKSADPGHHICRECEGYRTTPREGFHGLTRAEIEATLSASEGMADLPKMEPEAKVSFTVRDADADLFDVRVGLSCNIGFDRDRNEWRAWDEHGNEAWADWQPLAAARLFVAKLEADDA
jgi:hypothetical protein